MRYLLASLALLSLHQCSVGGVNEVRACAHDWVERAGSCYQFVPPSEEFEGSFVNAMAFCRNKGAHLVVFNDRKELVGS